MIELPLNTTPGQDVAISIAKKSVANDDIVESLLAVIHDLDQQISDWKSVSSCQTLNQLATRLYEGRKDGTA